MNKAPEQQPQKPMEDDEENNIASGLEREDEAEDEGAVEEDGWKCPWCARQILKYKPLTRNPRKNPTAKYEKRERK